VYVYEFSHPTVVPGYPECAGKVRRLDFVHRPTGPARPAPRLLSKLCCDSLMALHRRSEGESLWSVGFGSSGRDGYEHASTRAPVDLTSCAKTHMDVVEILFSFPLREDGGW
ncbi:unnamed protein product, partial [Phaeothamnion confervicola]